jgi:hypothetical protein
MLNKIILALVISFCIIAGTSFTTNYLYTLEQKAAVAQVEPGSAVGEKTFIKANSTGMINMVGIVLLIAVWLPVVFYKPKQNHEETPR